MDPTLQQAAPPPPTGAPPAPAIAVKPPPPPEAAAPVEPPAPATFAEAVQVFADGVFDALVEMFGPLGPIYAFAAVAALVIAAAIPLLLAKKRDPIDRLSAPVAGLRDLKAGQPVGAALRAEKGAGRLDGLASVLEPKDEKEFSAIRLKLMQAGYRSRRAVRTFNFLRAALAFGMTVTVFIYLSLSGVEPGSAKFMVIVGMALIIGYMGPNYWITRRKQERQQEITNGFPDALDLMLICVEAGQSLDQSLMRVAAEIRHAHPVLAEEFQIVSAEMRAGKDRASVLRDFSQRAGVNDVSSFVTVLVQSASFGTSVAEALRVYAAEMRDKRLMRAEEKANVLPTKLTLGTMFFTVPPLMLILIGPSLIDIVNALEGFR